MKLKIFVIIIVFLNACSPTAEDYFEMSNTKKKNGKFYEAIIDLNIAIEKNPDYFVYYLFRAEVKEKIKDYKGAINDYNKAILLRPYEEDFYSYRAEIKKKIKDY